MALTEYWGNCPPNEIGSLSVWRIKWLVSRYDRCRQWLSFLFRPGKYWFVERFARPASLRRQVKTYCVDSPSHVPSSRSMSHSTGHGPGNKKSPCSSADTHTLFSSPAARLTRSLFLGVFYPRYLVRGLIYPLCHVAWEMESASPLSQGQIQSCSANKISVEESADQFSPSARRSNVEMMPCQRCN